MSRRDWELTVVVACVIAAIALYFTAHVAFAVFVFLAVISLVAWIFDPWLKRRLFSQLADPSPDPKADADLRRRCRQLGQQIAFFAANRRANDPSQVPHWHGLPADATEDQKNESFNRYTGGMIRYGTETQNLYNVQFMGPALALYGELAARGWAGDVPRIRFEYPTNQLGIEDVARTLQVIGEG